MAMKIVKNKSESQWRWAILFFTCVMMIGNYYCYDIPAALNSQMDDYMGKPEDFETLFSLLYTVYSIPNVILPFFGGYFVDRLGVRLCLIVFASLITLGQFIFAIGLSAKSWPIMFLGRVVYGLGGENLGVGNSAILSIWFEGKELAFAFGLNLSIARLGSVINNLVSPTLANGMNIQFAFWFGVILCGGSIVACLLISSIDKFVDSTMGGKGAHSLLTNPLAEDEETDKEIEEKNRNLRKTLMSEAEGKAEVLQARHSIERSPSSSGFHMKRVKSSEPETSRSPSLPTSVRYR
jgi:MFS family permease